MFFVGISNIRYGNMLTLMNVSGQLVEINQRSTTRKGKKRDTFAGLILQE